MRENPRMATVTASETHRHSLGVVRLDLELSDRIASILEELHLCEGSNASAVPPSHGHCPFPLS